MRTRPALFHGTVPQVRNSPVTVQNVVTYDTVVSVNNADEKLKPGMTANLYIVIAQRPTRSGYRMRRCDSSPPERELSPSATPSGGADAHAAARPPGDEAIYALDPGATDARSRWR